MRQNIVLTGFMGTGKTTVGKNVANELKMSFIDSDDMIEQQEAMSISDIFALKGENVFREIESRVIKQISQMENMVIATGGGAVLNTENISNLRKNGIIIYFESDVNTIMRNTYNSDRPLLQHKDVKQRIEEMLEKRKEYYMNHDFKIDVASLSVEEVVKRVVEIYGR